MDIGVNDAIGYTLSRINPFRKAASVASDYASLLKPRTVAMHLLTATAAMTAAASGMPASSKLAAVLVGGGLTAGAANALNCYFDRELDKTMARTAGRALPSGRLSPSRAMAFAVGSGVAGAFVLLMASLPAALLSISALIFYSVVYTLWLKRSTSWSTVLSAGIGAVPPLVGWLVEGARFSSVPILMAALIAIWTPLHFWALAGWRRDEYAVARLQVIPAGMRGWAPLLFIGLAAVSAWLMDAAGLGQIFAATAVLFTAGFTAIWFSAIMNKDRAAMRRPYLFSILYLAVVFALIIGGSLLR
jgi:heme o synthase